jgi:hypothetical protein
MKFLDIEHLVLDMRRDEATLLGKVLTLALPLMGNTLLADQEATVMGWIGQFREILK